MLQTVARARLVAHAASGKLTGFGGGAARGRSIHPVGIDAGGATSDSAGLCAVLPVVRARRTDAFRKPGAAVTSGGAVSVGEANLSATSTRAVRALLETLPTHAVARPAIAVRLTLGRAIDIADAGFTNCAAARIAITAGHTLLGSGFIAVGIQRAGCIAAASVGAHRTFADTTSVAARITITAGHTLFGRAVTDLFLGAGRGGSAARAAHVGRGVADLARSRTVGVLAAAALTGAGDRVADFAATTAVGVFAAARNAGVFRHVADVATATGCVAAAAGAAA